MPRHRHFTECQTPTAGQQHVHSEPSENHCQYKSCAAPSAVESYSADSTRDGDDDDDDDGDGDGDDVVGVGALV